MGALHIPPALAGVPVVAVAGSRSLPPGGSRLVARVARSLVSAGSSLVVGCAAGADAAALVAVPPGCVRVLCAFGPDAAGSAGRVSAVAEVSAFAAAGGSVVWWAGGCAARPLRARLAARTRAVVAEASALVVFFASPASRGSALAARCAAERGLPVLAFPLGFSQLPEFGPGCWASVSGSGCWSGAFEWVPSQNQISLF